MGLGLKKPADVPGAAWPAICIGLFVAFGGVLFGYDTGLISGIKEMDYWKAEFMTTSVPGNPGVNTSPESKEFWTAYFDNENNKGITAGQDSLIVSILSLGTFLGSLCAACVVPVVDFLGRRMAIIASCGIVFNFGVILQTVSTGQPVLIAGRFFAGFAVGLISMMIPLYQSETAPKWIRGVVVGAYQWAITIGLFLAAIVNYATRNRWDTGSYRIPIAIQFLWSLIICIGLIFLPETPRFLIKQDKHDKAALSLAQLRRLSADHPAVVEELGEIQANHDYEMSISKATYVDCFKGTVGRRLLTGCSLQALQQLAGINFIMYYGTTYFENAGQKGFTIQVITNVVNVVSTLPGLYLTDKMGRRGLLLMGAIGMAVCQFIVAIVGTVASNDDKAAQNALIAFVCFYIFFFASSWGPVAWVVTGEMFPLQVRAKCLSMTTATNWLFNFAIAYCTPYLTDSENANLGSKVFFIWGSCCAFSVAFVYFMIYETKGLTLEQVDELFNICGKAWKSKEYRAQVEAMSAADLLNEKRGRCDGSDSEKVEVRVEGVGEK